MIGFATALLGFVAIAVTLGSWADSNLPVKVKKDLASVLKGNGHTAAGSSSIVADSFLAVFDSAFDPGDRGRPLFLRAGFASCTLLFLMSIRWIWVHPERSSDTLSSALGSVGAAWPNITALALFVLVLNWLGDYLSLWETRSVVARLAAARSLPGRLWWLLADLLATVAIYCVGIACAMLLFARVYELDTDLETVRETLVAVFLKGGLTFSHDDEFMDPFALFFHTSLFTSVWAWALMLGGILWSLTFGSRVLERRGFNALYEKAPVTCILIYGAVFLNCGFWLLDGAFSLLGGAASDSVSTALR